MSLCAQEMRSIECFVGAGRDARTNTEVVNRNGGLNLYTERRAKTPHRRRVTSRYYV